MIDLKIGDNLEELPKLPNCSVQCCVTSPPYYGLRDYGVSPTKWPEVTYSPLIGVPEITVPQMECCHGLEPDVLSYVGHEVLTFREVRRVLRDDGTLWLNLGDSYAGSNKGQCKDVAHDPKNRKTDGMILDYCKVSNGLKRKDLIGVPWRVVFALQADGWFLRLDNIWNKTNPMTESVQDRPTKAHEYIFLIAKSEKYFYDNEAVKEKAISNDNRRPATSQGAKQLDSRKVWHSGEKRTSGDPTKRNKRSVWTFPVKPYRGTHFATFPLDLVDPCLKAGTSEKGCCPECGSPWARVIGEIKGANGNKRGQSSTKLNDIKNVTTVGWEPSCSCNAGDPIPCTVLDPFGGSGTVGEWCRHNGRDSIIIELNPDYKPHIEERTMAKIPELFSY